MILMSRCWFLFLSWTTALVILCNGAGAKQEKDSSTTPQLPLPTCHEWTGRSSCDVEPNLHVMTVRYQSFHEHFYAYRAPDVATFYNATIGSKTIVNPKFQGLFGKFVNLSKDPIKVYWKSDKGREYVHITDIAPFSSAGTATFPGHTFIVTLPDTDPNSMNNKKPLIEWKIQADNSLYYYDPYNSNPVAAQKALSTDQYHFYYLQLQNRAFAHQYREFTGTDWLALYKEKHPPLFHMWRADSFGQTHQVITNEIHFVEIPPGLEHGVSRYGPRPDRIAAVRKYRHQLPELQLTLKAISCAPRVFEIPNFLSPVEVDHILNIAQSAGMQRSASSAGSSNHQLVPDEEDTTRTSRNTWIPRHHDMILEVIHRRAADVLQIDESLLRWRRQSEIPEFTDSVISIAEQIQLVHYAVGQEYTPHHDFFMPALVHGQPSRFATMLLYLNDDMEGGETEFPRWLNAETSEGLKIKPERGKAVLFYNMLPDGNYDERSIHAALPVTKGEKYLANFWVWDPYLDHTVTASS